MSKFILGGSFPQYEVTVASPHDKHLSQDKLTKFPAFKNWLSTLQQSLDLQKQEDHTFHSDPYRLRKIEVQSVDWFGPEGGKLGFVKLKATVTTDTNEREGKQGLPGAVFLRGGSVGMLVIVQSDDAPIGTEQDKYVILTIQPRIAAGSLALAELPAGMIDDGTFAGKAAQEIEEECKMKIPESELINMSELALSPSENTTFWRKSQSNPNSKNLKETLQNAMYPSPGACDEFMPLFLYQKRMPKDELEELSGRLTGLRDEGEMITLRLVRLEDLWKEGGRDAKALAALALYEGLRREGKIK